MDKSKPDNLTKSDKSDKSICNLILVPSFGRIFVRTNLFNRENLDFSLNANNLIDETSCINRLLPFLSSRAIKSEFPSNFQELNKSGEDAEDGEEEEQVALQELTEVEGKKVKLLEEKR